MRLSIGMPVWTKVAQRPAAERTDWARFLRALRVHEDGHIRIFRAEAPTSYQLLTQSTPDAINDVLAKETARIEALSDAYDHRTDHGQSQQTPHGTTVITVPP
jgi:hypothetical protein